MTRGVSEDHKTLPLKLACNLSNGSKEKYKYVYVLKIPRLCEKNKLQW